MLKAAIRVRAFSLSVASSLLFAAPAFADVVTDWNTIAIDLLRATNAGANPAARALAIVSLSVSDAVGSIEGRYSTYLPAIAVEGEASADAAAASAAATALVALFPSQQAAIAQALSDTLATLPDDAARAAGITVGQYAAQNLLAERANDGSTGSASYPGGTALGQWRPTPPGNLAAAQPFWATVTPFVLETADQFRPPPPPKLPGLHYALAYNEVKQLGATGSSRRTADQSQIAQFWRPVSVIQWNEVARYVAVHRKLTLSQNARLFGLLNAAIADSRVAAWDAKYTYGAWRPITAVASGDADTNVFTDGDVNFVPYLETPNHPDYPSGHSTTGAAAAEVLRRFFGDRAKFTIGSDTVPGVTRSYRSFTEAAVENGRSRIYGGIHFSYADRAGQATGRDVGSFTFRKLL